MNQKTGDLQTPIEPQPCFGTQPYYKARLLFVDDLKLQMIADEKNSIITISKSDFLVLKYSQEKYAL